jgi:hypothetical protein
MVPTSTQALREKTQALQAQIEALRAEAVEQVKPLLQQFLVEYPEVRGIAWRQYIPYFNDGDTCTFSVNEPAFYFHNTDVDVGEDIYEHELPFRRGIDGVSAETLAACHDLKKELTGDGMSDALETLFGEHTIVVVTREGVSVSDYSDHD